jgi:hypothetical protein
MTITNQVQKINRLNELAQIARKRYLEQGGNPHLSVGSLNNNDCLTDEEKQELRLLLNQVITEEKLTKYQEKKRLLRDLAGPDTVKL